MKYMLDTNICIYIIKKKPEKVFEKFCSLKPGDICISVVTLAELQFGIEKSQNKERNKLALVYFLAPVEIIPFSEKAAVSFGKIRAELEQKGSIIGAYDMMIAAHCMSEGLALVSNNISEFKRIDGLKLENWI
jgi:tRNA(fMet)-specific endonuclease VapC